MTGHAHMTLYIEPGTPILGLWCPTCLLPSGYSYPLYVLTVDGPRHIATVRRCHDCGTCLTEEQA